MKYCLLCAVIVSLSHPAKAEQTYQQILQGKYDKLARGFEVNDIKPYAKVLAPEYVLQVPGRADKHRESILADFKKQMSNMHNSVWKREVVKVDTFKGLIVAIVVSQFKGMYESGGKTSVFENKATSEDTWVKKPGGELMLVKSKLLKMKTKIDGHEIPGI